MLLHNGNSYPSFPMTHSVHLKEKYISVKMLLDALKYDEYGWEVIGDFKMVSFLMSLQGSSQKFHVSFASGTAVIPWRTIIESTGKNGPSSLWGRVTSSGNRW